MTSSSPGTARLRLLALAVACVAYASTTTLAQNGETDVVPLAQHVHDAHPTAITREGSGTSWVPGETRMYGLHREVKGWDLMVHGTAYAQFILESGTEHHRGRQAGSINWLMA